MRHDDHDDDTLVADARRAQRLVLPRNGGRAEAQGVLEVLALVAIVLIESRLAWGTAVLLIAHKFGVLTGDGAAQVIEFLTRVAG